MVRQSTVFRQSYRAFIHLCARQRLPWLHPLPRSNYRSHCLNMFGASHWTLSLISSSSPAPLRARPSRPGAENGCEPVRLAEHLHIVCRAIPCMRLYAPFHMSKVYGSLHGSACARSLTTCSPHLNRSIIPRARGDSVWSECHKTKYSRACGRPHSSHHLSLLKLPRCCPVLLYRFVDRGIPVVRSVSFLILVFDGAERPPFPIYKNIV